VKRDSEISPRIVRKMSLARHTARTGEMNVHEKY
jgi:hypothetical protein